MTDVLLKDNEKIVVTAKKSTNKLPFIVCLVSAGIIALILLSVYLSMADKLSLDSLLIISFGIFFLVIFILLLIIYLVIYLNKNSPLILTSQRILIYGLKQKGYFEIELKNLTSWNNRLVKNFTAVGSAAENMKMACIFNFYVNETGYKTSKIKNYDEVINGLNNIKID